MISSCEMALKAVMERELAHVNMLVKSDIQSNYSKETLVTVLQYIESRIKSLA